MNISNQAIGILLVVALAVGVAIGASTLGTTDSQPTQPASQLALSLGHDHPSGLVARQLPAGGSRSSSPRSGAERPEELARMLTRGVTQAQQQWDVMESGFTRERRDVEWAAQLEADLDDIAADPMMAVADDPHSLAVDCRSRTCRVSATFRTRTAAEDWSQVYIVSAGRTLPRAMMQVLPLEGGLAEVRIYGAP